MMKFLSALVTTVLGVTLLSAAPAHAQREPGRIGILEMKASTPNSLTFTWDEEPRADHYIVERGRSLGMARRKDIEKTKDNRITVRGLRAGELYCFTVRAVNEKGAGRKSHKGCQRPTDARGRAKGPTYRVVTYNICVNVCGRWGSRRSRAARLVRDTRPALVALQEAPADSGMATAIGGMRQVAAEGGKALLVRDSRFSVATKRGKKLAGSFSLGRDSKKRNAPQRHAVWAELVDRQHRNKHVLFVGVHLAPGGDTRKADQIRTRNVEKLVAGIKRVQRRGVRVVLAGDFNTHQGKNHNRATKALKKSSPLESSYFMTRRWMKSNYNSGTRSLSKPATGTAWGYHLDQVWVNPRSSVVKLWQNANPIKNGRYPSPLISNHSPVLVEVRIN